MIKKDISGREIGRRLGLSHGTVSATIRGKSNAYRIRKGIADALGTTVEELWKEEEEQ